MSHVCAKSPGYFFVLYYMERRITTSSLTKKLTNVQLARQQMKKKIGFEWQSKIA